MKNRILIASIVLCSAVNCINATLLRDEQAILAGGACAVIGAAGIGATLWGARHCIRQVPKPLRSAVMRLYKKKIEKLLIAGLTPSAFLTLLGAILCCWGTYSVAKWKIQGHQITKKHADLYIKVAGNESIRINDTQSVANFRDAQQDLDSYEAEKKRFDRCLYRTSSRTQKDLEAAQATEREKAEVAWSTLPHETKDALLGLGYVQPR